MVNRFRNYVVWYPIVIIISFIMLIPLFYMISTALKTQGQVLNLNSPLIPTNPHWSNFKQAWTAAPFPRFFLNSAIFSISATAGQIVTSAMSGYAFARLKFPGKTIFFYAILSGLMIPFDVVMVPVIEIIHAFGWIDTYLGLIVPNIASALGMFLFRQYFLTLPKELDEAATVDGAGKFRIFVQIYLPLTKPIMAAFAILSFLANWNNFLFPLLVTHSEKMMVLPLGLSVFRSSYSSEYNLLMAASLIVIIPILIISLFAQKQIINGITLGSGK